MTSKEALENLTFYIPYEKHTYSECNAKINECYEIIKKDLERLEKLEKENKVLREKVNHFKNVKNRYRRNAKFVEKENKELLMALENKNKEIGNLKKLIHDNPYKKAIEILKEQTCKVKPDDDLLMQQNGKLIEENNKMKIIIDMLLYEEMKRFVDEGCLLFIKKFLYYEKW